jgi:hypothetical protein
MYDIINFQVTILTWRDNTQLISKLPVGIKTLATLQKFGIGLCNQPVQCSYQRFLSTHDLRNVFISGQFSVRFLSTFHACYMTSLSIFTDSVTTKILIVEGQQITGLTPALLRTNILISSSVSSRFHPVRQGFLTFGPWTPWCYAGWVQRVHGRTMEN